MRIFRGHTQQVRGVAYTPDGSTIASCGDDGSVRLWDLASAQPLANLAEKLGGGQVTVYDVAISPDGGRLASAWGDRFVRLWDLPAQAGPAILQGHGRAVTSVAFDGDSNLLTAAGAGNGIGEAGLWDLVTGEHRIVPIEHEGGWSIAVDPTSNLVAIGTSGNSGALRLWDRKTPPRPFHRTACSWVRSLAYSPDGSSLAQANLGGVATVWDLTEKPRERFSLVGHAARITAVAFSPDGLNLATASADGNVRLWDAETGAERACFGWALGRLGCVAFAPDGMTIAAGGERDIVVWDVEA